MKKRILNFIVVILLIVPVSFISVGCAGVTSAGVNRSLLAKETDKVSVPYTVVVDEQSRDMVCETEVFRTPMPMWWYFTMFGLAGWAIQKGEAIDKAAGKKDPLADRRGAFLAGEAFTQAVKRISAPRGEIHSVLQLRLLRFQPVFTMEGTGANRRLAVNIEFLATFLENGATTHSAYACDYHIEPGSFSSQKEKDLLREMMDLSIVHWAKQLSQMPANSKESAHFPEDHQGEFSIEKGQCSYQIFAQYNAIAQ